MKSKNKFCFVDGSLTKPENNNPEVHAWEKCNLMVIAWLYNIIDKTLHGSVAYAETATEIWTDLKECYSQPRIQNAVSVAISVSVAKRQNRSNTAIAFHIAAIAA